MLDKLFGLFKDVSNLEFIDQGENDFGFQFDGTLEVNFGSWKAGYKGLFYVNLVKLQITEYHSEVADEPKILDITHFKIVE